jgi:molecular chaperone HtpG
MELPRFLSDLLEPHHELSAMVNLAIARLEPWIGNSQMPFFPEYTDHSLKHIEQVIGTATDLATEEAQNLLSANDAAVLVIAICLHDCAMHLTVDGFLSLISADSKWKPVLDFDSTPWNVLWEDFMGEARRFDGRKLLALFGDTDPVHRPPDKITDFSMRDRLLIGEFIRRYHARLAHEIALYGIPGVKGGSVAVIEVASEPGYSLADISGTIARSHGIPLRSAVEYIRRKYHIREFQGVHAAFLMVLVRVADYLQIQAKRAPTEVLEVRALTSPVSRNEWKVHASVRNITTAGDDPEAILIDAQPSDVHTFLRLQDWLSGIQNELDISWAVLGETYGRFHQERLDSLRLKLRRIRSNLDDIKDFARRATYVPARISFDAANPDLLKLLVGPLYGDDPSVGLRELIQNAVDAVRELEELLKHRPDLRSSDIRPQDADVIVTIECDEEEQPTRIVVSDRGIGMNLDVVQNYFLKAGASFRRSDVWPKTFEDPAGRSKVLRSGRFGVGALASFLIGNEIELTTRHIESPPDRAITFWASLDEASLSLRWCSAPVGTEVKIKIDSKRREDVGNAFETEWIFKNPDRQIMFWDGLGHYFAASPSVKRVLKFRIGSDTRTIEPALYKVFPSENSTAQTPWRCFGTTEYLKIFWTYDSAPDVSCNGIVVENTRGFSTKKHLIDYDYIKTPNLLVYDRDGKLPLNLQRTALASTNVGFSDELLLSITDDLIAYALLTGPTDLPKNASDLFWLVGEYPGFVDRYVWGRISNSHRWFLTAEGFGLLDYHIILESRPHALFIAYCGPRLTKDAVFQKVRPNDVFPEGLSFFFCDGLDPSKVNDRKYLARSLLEWDASDFWGFPPPLRGIAIAGRRVFVRKSVLKSLLRERVLGQGLKRVLENVKPEAEYDDWIVVALGNCPAARTLDIEKVFSKPLPKFIDAMAECYLSADPARSTQGSIVANRWAELIGSPTIPYDMKMRQHAAPLAYQKLQIYLELWQRELAEKERKLKEEVEAEESYLQG